jgi:hypothetical protein
MFLKDTRHHTYRFKHIGAIGGVVLLLTLVLAACGTGQQVATSNATPEPEEPDIIQTVGEPEPTPTVVVEGTVVPDVAEENQVTMPDTEMQLAMTEPATSLALINEDTQSYMSETLKVEGYLTELIGPRMVRLQESTDSDTPSILVILDNEEQVVTEDTISFVAGTVYQFDQDTMPQDYELDISSEQVSAFQGQPVIVAQRIWNAEGTAVANVTPADITSQPEVFIGNEVHMTGTISEVLSPQLLRLNSTGGEASDNVILVVMNEEQAQGSNLAEGTSIQIAGTVQTFVQSDIEQHSNAELSSDLYGQYENQPVIIASSITPL